jgi:uncharacterized protein (DUF983 family)
VGKLFRGWFRMHPHCKQCGLRFERAPGYFLGSTYINYAATAVLVTIAYLVLRFGVGLERHHVLAPLLAFCVMFPLFFFRYARSWWLAMDSYIDPQSFESDDLEHPAIEHDEREHTGGNPS